MYERDIPCVHLGFTLANSDRIDKLIRLAGKNISSFVFRNSAKCVYVCVCNKGLKCIPIDSRPAFRAAGAARRSNSRQQIYLPGDLLRNKFRIVDHVRPSESVCRLRARSRMCPLTQRYRSEYPSELGRRLCVRARNLIGEIR